MSTHRGLRVPDGRAPAVVDALVGRGLLDPARRREAADVVEAILRPRETTAGPSGSRLPELLGYLGGALVISAAALFFALQWGDLTSGQQVVLLATSAVVLAVAAGVLVGFGTRLGSGCTSGHGVCGVSRLSPRSLAATAVFMAAGIATVAVMRMLGVVA